MRRISEGDFGGTSQGLRRDPAMSLRRDFTGTPKRPRLTPEKVALGGFTKSGGTWLLSNAPMWGRPVQCPFAASSTSGLVGGGVQRYHRS